jgi:hypothetical protein
MSSIAVARQQRARDLGAREASYFAARDGDSEAQRLLDTIAACKDTQNTDMARFATLCDRYDNLYYPFAIGIFGADHRPESYVRGQNHLSLNTYPVYVDVPAALLSVPPVENIMPADPEAKGSSELATMVERMYFAWKDEEKWELKSQKAATVKNLYGRTAAKVWWDDERKKPCVSIIDQPRNLWLGWSSTDYTRLDWAIYVYRMSPTAVTEEFGLEVDPSTGADGNQYPRVHTVVPGDDSFARSRRTAEANRDIGMVEVHDYWYRKRKAGAKLVKGKKTPMETWNAILVGNVLVKDEMHREYEGKMPYVPVFNTYIPGAPDGRAAFFDIEQLLAEKEQRLEGMGTLISKATSGQLWQLTGPDAPDRVPVGVKPKPDTVVAPGAGNRIEHIEPFIPEFQFEQFMDRLDREITDASGLNDLLRGLAPAAVLSSSKAINALVANYEARMSMGRGLFYEWRIGTWDLIKTVWGSYDKRLRDIFKVAGRLSLKNPSLTPRDDLEVAQMAGNLLQQKIWSQVRAMDMTGVEDPQAEQAQIREESTDASLFPERVQTQAALMATFQQMGISAQQAGQAAPGQMGDAAMAARMAANGGVSGAPTGEAPVTPEQPANAQDAALAALMAGGAQQTGPGFNAVSQTQVKGGEASNRILLQQPIGPQGQGG